MSTHSICFDGETRNIIPESSLLLNSPVITYTLLIRIGSTCRSLKNNKSHSYS